MTRPTLAHSRRLRRSARVWLTVPLVLLVALLLGACSGLGGAAGGGSSSNTIVFGAPISLTGSLAKEGGLTRDGYEIWKDKYNEAGGIKVGGKQYKIETKYYDDESDAQKSATLARNPRISRNRASWLVLWARPSRSARTGGSAGSAVRAVSGTGGAGYCRASSNQGPYGGVSARS